MQRLLSKLKPKPKPPVEFKMNKYQQAAVRAKNFARMYIKKCGTHLSSNDLPLEAFLSLSQAIQKLRSSPDDLFLKLEQDEALFSFYEANRLWKHVSLGNCDELALLALEYILLYEPDIDAEYFKLYPDHALLVVGRDPQSDPTKPETWGQNAYFCDPWDDSVFPASEYKNKLKSYYFTRVLKHKSTDEEILVVSTHSKLEATPLELFTEDRRAFVSDKYGNKLYPLSHFTRIHEFKTTGRHINYTVPFNSAVNHFEVKPKLSTASLRAAQKKEKLDEQLQAKLKIIYEALQELFATLITIRTMVRQRSGEENADYLLLEMIITKTDSLIKKHGELKKESGKQESIKTRLTEIRSRLEQKYKKDDPYFQNLSAMIDRELKECKTESNYYQQREKCRGELQAALSDAQQLIDLLPSSRETNDLRFFKMPDINDEAFEAREEFRGRLDRLIVTKN